jgi:hypothetical protein
LVIAENIDVLKDALVLLLVANGGGADIVFVIGALRFACGHASAFDANFRPIAEYPVLFAIFIDKAFRTGGAIMEALVSGLVAAIYRAFGGIIAAIFLSVTVPVQTDIPHRAKFAVIAGVGVICGDASLRGDAGLGGAFIPVIRTGEGIGMAALAGLADLGAIAEVAIVGAIGIGGALIATAIPVHIGTALTIRATG